MFLKRSFSLHEGVGSQGNVGKQGSRIRILAYGFKFSLQEWILEEY